MLERPITSLILEGSILTARRTDTEGRPSIFLSVIGRPEDDRSLWSVRASEERYRKHIKYLPIPLLQVDAREIGGVFSELKLEGKIGRAHVCTPVTNAHLVCRLLLVQTKSYSYTISFRTNRTVTSFRSYTP